LESSTSIGVGSSFRLEVSGSADRTTFRRLLPRLVALAFVWRFFPHCMGSTSVPGSRARKGWRSRSGASIVNASTRSEPNTTFSAPWN
jgi:hypothetical protein